MEENKMNPNSGNENNLEKTSIMSAGVVGKDAESGKGVEPSGAQAQKPSPQTENAGNAAPDHTQIEPARHPKPEAMPAQAPPPMGGAAAAPPVGAASEELKTALKNAAGDKGGTVSKGAAIGGAAAAGLAGVALGTAYSDEIQAALSGPGGSADDPASSEAAPADADLAAGEEGAVPESDFLNVSYTDQSGNAYAVYLSDLDNDGKIDFAEADITAVDGSNIHITASGDGFMNLLLDPATMAGPAAYIEQGGYAIPASLVDLSPVHTLYDIMPGDTLSEIAAAHNTSIVNLLELNPNITDPDRILAGEQLVIPTDDNIADPYEGYDEYLEGIDDVVQPADIIAVDSGLQAFNEPGPEGLNDPGSEPFDHPGQDLDDPNFEDVSLATELTDAGPDGQFVEVDWASFDDEPLSEPSDDYEVLLSNTDFENYDCETYSVDYNFDGLSDADFAAADFL